MPRATRRRGDGPPPASPDSARQSSVEASADSNQAKDEITARTGYGVYKSVDGASAQPSRTPGEGCRSICCGTRARQGASRSRQSVARAEKLTKPFALSSTTNKPMSTILDATRVVLSGTRARGRLKNTVRRLAPRQNQGSRAMLAQAGRRTSFLRIVGRERRSGCRARRRVRAGRADRARSGRVRPEVPAKPFADRARPPARRVDTRADGRRCAPRGRRGRGAPGADTLFCNVPW